MAYKASKASAMSESARESSLNDSSSSERPGGSESTLHEVGEVYVYIPPELSAAGVELKIVGAVRVINKVSFVLLYLFL